MASVLGECLLLFHYQSLLGAGPHEVHLAGTPILPCDLVGEPVSRDWPLVLLEPLARCPEVADRQGTTVLAALGTSVEIASLLAPLRFRAVTERSARRRSLRPGTLAGLADRSPEGTEERRAPCNAVYTALPQRELALKKS